MESSISHYHEGGHPGCEGCDIWHAGPLDSDPSRVIEARLESVERGPVGLLLRSLASFGLQMSKGWR
eukprot:430563-Alexandrium_andersonii.AAC.1